EEICQKYQLDTSRSKLTPIAFGMIWPPQESDKPLRSNSEYMSLVGSLLYVANLSRPDALYAASMLCRHMQRPYAKHLQAARHLAIHLNSTKGRHLNYIRKTDNIHHQINIYCDANFGDPNLNMKSQTGLVICHNSNVISWNSGLQSTVAQSTAEAE